jgi:NAD(P)-dependent dehydrogenase (short-subunit alcohol dehydrogenase family)
MLSLRSIFTYYVLNWSKTVGIYATDKGGLKILTKSMADEWAQFNI